MDKEIEALVECADCGNGVQIKREDGFVWFLCQVHGEMGRMREEKFFQLHRDAAGQVTKLEGFNTPGKIIYYHIPGDPTQTN